MFVKPDFPLVEPYTSKTVVFKFRGREFRFALSHGLFSSAGVDRGTALLLKVLSREWDEDRAPGRPPPRTILDAGCGAGIIAVCAAAALRDLYGGAAVQAGAVDGGPAFHVRAQDRDELARLFTAYNAGANGIGPEYLSAHTEALLSGPPGSRWDLILSNIPAKAGRPVLEDFIRRPAFLLRPGGKVMIVAVNTLADFFRSLIRRAGGELLREDRGPEHTVFAYGAGQDPEAARAVVEEPPLQTAGPARAGEDLLISRPFYIRRRAEYELAGIPLGLDTIHGAAGFDRPGGAAEAAAKLAIRLGRESFVSAAPAVLIHEPEQGWFPAWLLAFLEQERDGANVRRNYPVKAMVLSGRNILALEAARHNLREARQLIPPAAENAGPEPAIIPGVELSPAGLAGLAESGGSAAAGRFGFIAAFPETVPRTDRRAALWDGLAAFLAPRGLALIALPSSEADRFDRAKPPGFRRLGDLKRKGFRALAYGKTRET
jgi:16S rRNA G1207 methylase RsmC